MRFAGDSADLLVDRGAQFCSGHVAGCSPLCRRVRDGYRFRALVLCHEKSGEYFESQQPDFYLSVPFAGVHLLYSGRAYPALHIHWPGSDHDGAMDSAEKSEGSGRGPEPWLTGLSTWFEPPEVRSIPA